jgi:hypothetical protein
VTIKLRSYLRRRALARRRAGQPIEDFELWDEARADLGDRELYGRSSKYAMGDFMSVPHRTGRCTG